jgi:hypothetical protein
VSADAGNTSKLGSDGKIFTPGGTGTAYTLPPATATTIGGVKPGAGLTVATDGTLAGVANPVGGSVPDLKLWMGTQAAYDAIATKDTKTVYYIV